MAVDMTEAHKLLKEAGFYAMAPNVDAYCYINDARTRTVFINGREIARQNSLEGLKDLIKTRKQSIMGLNGSNN